MVLEVFLPRCRTGLVILGYQAGHEKRVGRQIVVKVHSAANQGLNTSSIRHEKKHFGRDARRG